MPENPEVRRTVKIEESVLSFNEKKAKEIMTLHRSKGIFTINVMGSPGSGKTTFIIETIKALRDKYRFAVIEGDIASTIDSEKIKAIGVNSIQINTGGICHLDAGMIEKAFSYINLDETDIVFIENVGNLVCPADFNLGEDIRVALLSIPEGDDKVHKYPMIFRACNVVAVSKTDLMEHFDFNVTSTKETLKKLNPEIKTFEINSKAKESFIEWCKWLDERIGSVFRA